MEGDCGGCLRTNASNQMKCPLVLNVPQEAEHRGAARKGQFAGTGKC
jgi:hypothetical protein